MDDEAARIANIGQMREELDASNQLDARIVAAFEPEGKNGARALGNKPLSEGTVRISRQACVIHPRGLRMFFKPASDRKRILAMTCHAQRQGLDPVDDEEGVQGCYGRAEIAE